jgi:hypothetical protein
MNDKDESVKDLVLRLRNENKVVFHTIEGLASVDIDEFLKQPIEGVLYDLNRLPEVVLSNIEDPKWVNDFAVFLVIKRQSARIAMLESQLAWIPVSERLPERQGNTELGVRYLVLYEGIYADVCVFFPTNKTWFREGVDKTAYVTHWLPEPPHESRIQEAQK